MTYIGLIFAMMAGLRYMVLFFLLLGGSCMVHAQSSMYEEDVKPFSGGIAAGLNFAQVDGDMYFGYNKAGVSVGTFVQIHFVVKGKKESISYFQIHFTQRWGVGMEILYSQKGSRGDAVIESPFSGTSISQCHIGLSYVEVPVVLQYRYASFCLEAGASYSRLVRTNEWIYTPQEFPIDKEKNRFNNTDIEYVFGLSRKIYKHWHANVRFQYSVVSIRPIERVPTGYGYGSKGQFNNLFCARLMYVL